MTTRKITGLAIGAVLLAAGCATSFTGSAHVEGGRAGCRAKCDGLGMEEGGMVYIGEYSSACICLVPGQSAANGRVLVAQAGGVAAAVAGVEMQRRAAQQRQQSSAQ
jgi:hypothetical protein